MKPAGNIILVTGSSGRIGTVVMRRLRQSFDNVVGFDQNAPTPPPDCVRIAVDIASSLRVTEGGCDIAIATSQRASKKGKFTS